MNKVIIYLKDNTQIDTNIFIGNIFDASNIENIKNNNINAVFNISPVDIPKSKDIRYYNLSIDDSPVVDIYTHLPNVISYIDKEITNGSKILVNCQVGVSRSASVVISYLLYKYGQLFAYNYDIAYNILKKCRNIVRPNDGFRQQLIKFSDELKEKNIMVVY